MLTLRDEQILAEQDAKEALVRAEHDTPIGNINNARQALRVLAPNPTLMAVDARLVVAAKQVTRELTCGYDCSCPSRLHHDVQYILDHYAAPIKRSNTAFYMDQLAEALALDVERAAER